MTSESQRRGSLSVKSKADKVRFQSVDLGEQSVDEGAEWWIDFNNAPIDRPLELGPGDGVRVELTGDEVVFRVPN